MLKVGLLIGFWLIEMVWNVIYRFLFVVLIYKKFLLLEFKIFNIIILI